MKRERDPSGVEEDDDRGPGFIEPDCVVGELNQINSLFSAWNLRSVKITLNFMLRFNPALH